MPNQRADAQQVLRVAPIVPGRATELTKGIEFGMMEARWSAALFGWRVEVARDPSDAHAIILGDTTPPRLQGIPVIRIASEGLATAGRDELFLISTRGAADSVAWHSDLKRFGAQQLNDRYRAATGQAMSADAWAAWFALKILLESAVRAGSVESARLVQQLRRAETRFDGHKGRQLHFDESGHLVHPLYVIPRSPSP